MKKEILLFFYLGLLFPISLISQEEIILKATEKKSFDFNYFNLTDQSSVILTHLFEKADPKSYKSITYKLHNDWSIALGKLPNDSKKSRLTLSLEDQQIEGLASYKGVSIDHFFLPSAYLAKVEVSSIDTSFIIPLNVETDNLTASKIIEIAPSKSIKIHIQELGFRYKKGQASNLLKYKNNIDELHQTLDYLNDEVSNLESWNLSEYNPDKILEYNKQRDSWHKNMIEGHLKREFWEIVPSNILKTKGLLRLKTKARNIFEKKDDLLSKKLDNLPWLYYERGQDNLREKEFKKVENDIQKIIKINENFLPTYILAMRADWRKNGMNSGIKKLAKIETLYDKADAKERQEVSKLSKYITRYYSREVEESLQKKDYQTAESTILILDSLCTSLKIISCPSITKENQIDAIYEQKYNDFLDSTQYSIDNNDFQSAFNTLRLSEKIYKERNLENKRDFNQLKKQTIRGKWNELMVETEIAQNKLLKLSYSNYDEDLEQLEQQVAKINTVNSFQKEYENFLPGSYLFSDRKLNKLFYEFHYMHAKTYSNEKNWEASLQQLTFAKSKSKKASLPFKYLSKKVIIERQKELKESTLSYLSKSKKYSTLKKFQKALKFLNRAERELSNLQKLGNSKLNPASNKIFLIAEKLKVLLKQEKINISQSAIKHSIQVGDFDSAKKYNSISVDAGENSNLKGIEQQELTSLWSQAQNKFKKGKYLDVINLLNRAEELYKNHQFKNINIDEILQKRIEAAEAAIIHKYNNTENDKYNSLDSIEEILVEIEDWIKAYNIPRENKISELLSTYQSNLKTAFSVEVKEAIEDLENNPKKNISKLFILQSKYFNNSNLKNQLEQPDYIPLSDLLKTKGKEIAYRGAIFFSQQKEYRKSTSLLTQALIDDYPWKETKKFQKNLGKKLSILDNTSGKFTRAKSGVSYYIPNTLKKRKIKKFKRSYKRNFFKG